MVRKYLLGCIIFSFISCSSKTQEDSIQFSIDKNLLENSIAIDSLNFSFSPPLGWLADSSKFLNHTIQKYQDEEISTYSIHINEVFYDSSLTSFCSVSLIHSTDSLDINYFTDQFNFILLKQLSPENVKKARFTSNGMEIIQFLIMTETKVLFKLFFQPTNKYILQLDYAIDRSIYPNYIKKIESSIGSITTN